MKKIILILLFVFSIGIGTEVSAVKSVAAEPVDQIEEDISKSHAVSLEEAVILDLVKKKKRKKKKKKKKKKKRNLTNKLMWAYILTAVGAVLFAFIAYILFFISNSATVMIISIVLYALAFLLALVSPILFVIWLIYLFSEA